MNVFIASRETGAPSDWFSYPALRILQSASRDQFAVHRCVTSGAEADLVILATNAEFPPSGLGVLAEKVFRENLDRAFLISRADQPSPLWRGLHPSWPISDASLGMAAGWNYYHPNSAEPFIDPHLFVWPPSRLWSFVGSRYTHPVRAKLLALEDDRAHLEDTSGSAQSHLRGETGDGAAQFRRDYIEMLHDSKFVVCPRGMGASSMRIFEAMRAGRCPVIISDDWLPPPFVDWGACAIRLAESDLDRLPELLRERESEAEAMGERAQSEWRHVFGEEALFHHVVEACLLIARHQPPPLLGRLGNLCQAPYATEILRWAFQKAKRFPGK